MAWIMQGNRPVNTDSITTPGAPFVGDSPFTFWRINPNVNGGRPYVGLMIGVPALRDVSSSTIYCGDTQLTKIYCGDLPVTKIYCGDSQLL